jgi:hypothetical protein
MERVIVWSDNIRAHVGQLAGAGLAVYMIYTGTQLLREGHSLVGFQTIGIAIATGAVPFAARAYVQYRERVAQTNAIAKPPGR